VIRPDFDSHHNFVIASSIMLAMQHEQKYKPMVRAVRGVAYGVTGAYVGAILFLVTLIIDSFVPPQGTGMLWTREDLSHLFYIRWLESLCLAGGSFPSASSSEFTTVQNCHNGPEKQP
jgi:hypothetical protein